MAQFQRPVIAPVDAGTVSAPLVAAAKGPDPEAMNRALQAAMPALASCFEGIPTGSISVKFDAEPSGRARAVRVSGASERTDGCIRRTLVSIPLPSFEGSAPVEMDFPLTVANRPTTSVQRTTEVRAQAAPL